LHFARQPAGHEPHHTTSPKINEEVREHAEEYRKLSLWRLVAAAGKKWRRKNGELMPVPAMPPPVRPRSHGHG
jgi:hypothetical protein